MKKKQTVTLIGVLTDGQRVMRIDVPIHGKAASLYDLRVRPNVFLGEYSDVLSAKTAGERMLKPKAKGGR